MTGLAAFKFGSLKPQLQMIVRSGLSCLLILAAACISGWWAFDLKVNGAPMSARLHVLAEIDVQPSLDAKL